MNDEEIKRAINGCIWSCVGVEVVLDDAINTLYLNIEAAVNALKEHEIEDFKITNYDKKDMGVKSRLEGIINFLETWQLSFKKLHEKYYE